MGNGIQMEKITHKIANMPLRQAFIYTMAIMVGSILIMSGLTVYGCIWLQNKILPDSKIVSLTIATTDKYGNTGEIMQQFTLDEESEMGVLTPIGQEPVLNIANTPITIKKIESGFEMLSTKRKAIYTALSILIVILPILYSIVGVALSGVWFYKKKLAPPIKILSQATKKVCNQDLEFTVAYDVPDEMGELCHSFELMRGELYNNNKALWSMLDERKMLWASVAHDLRNPISIIKGYLEFLQENMKAGKLAEPKLACTLSNMELTTNRLARYTDSIRDISIVEEIEICRVKTVLPDFLAEVVEELRVLLPQNKLKLVTSMNISTCEVLIDKQIYYRIFENVFSNAMRYARRQISISFSMHEDSLITIVADDGCGFPEKVLRSKGMLLLPYDNENHHMGMGICSSRILCQKLGGRMALENDDSGGAVVKIETKTKA